MRSVYRRKYSLEQETLIPLISRTSGQTHDLRLRIYFHIYLIIRGISTDLYLLLKCLIRLELNVVIVSRSIHDAR